MNGSFLGQSLGGNRVTDGLFRPVEISNLSNALHCKTSGSCLRRRPENSISTSSGLNLAVRTLRITRGSIGGKCRSSNRVNVGEVASFPRGKEWTVQKFGGTCLATDQRIKDVVDLVVDSFKKDGKQAIVVSAMGSHVTSPVKVTDILLTMIQKASKADMGYLEDLNLLQDKYFTAARSVLGPDSAEFKEYSSGLLKDVLDLKAMFHAISVAGALTDAFSDFVVGHGEIWCAKMIAMAVNKRGIRCQFMDTREVMVVYSSDNHSVDVEYKKTEAGLDNWGRQHGVPDVILATGFIARNTEGQVTTLKRNGSDYSATIMGAMLQSNTIIIWTDVDGVFSADPRKVSEAVCLSSLSYHEAWELSYFGASVLHPRTTMPAMKYNIPIIIRNFFDLQKPGTVIRAASEEIMDTLPEVSIPIKGFATVDNVAMINVEGTGMVGVHGTASAIFTTIRDTGANVIMISQASSEHSVCFAVSQKDGAVVQRALNDRFKDALKAGRISKIEKIDDCCVLAAVGNQMHARKGVAATMFAALAKANINIRSIAQGCSEYNITALIDQKDAVRALRAVHGRFYLANLPVGLGVVGPGLIGQTFMEQVESQMTMLRDDFDMDVRVLAIANSKRMLLSDYPINIATWKDSFERNSVPVDLDAFADHLRNHYVPNSVIVDATASEVPARHYCDWIQKGIHIITPNKKFSSGRLEEYNWLKKFEKESYIHFFYEATVGAGLPVIATIQHLRQTGDKITKIEGIFSGTLSYIFNTFSKDVRFSDIIAKAKEEGYTEPDPRDDLAGMDVARKVTILARECGIGIELDSVPVRSLVPEKLRNVQSVDEFMKLLPQYDDDMTAMVDAAEKDNKCLRFVGIIDVASGTGSVELRSYPKSHPFCQLEGSDNIISITTQRYSKQPLIIRGPGAGAEVTAGGVFSDLLRLAAYLNSS